MLELCSRMQQQIPAGGKHTDYSQNQNPVDEIYCDEVKSRETGNSADRVGTMNYRRQCG